MTTSVELRRKNVLDILKTIAQNQPITKNDVAIKTGLTIVTINTVINGLIKKEILIEDGNTDSIGGRPASLYRVNSTKYYTVGLNIGIDEFTMQISDLSMNEIYKNHMLIEQGEQFSSFFNKFKGMFYESIVKFGITNQSILGIGVTVPGLVDTANGIIRFLPNALGWENIKLKQIFENEFEIKTIVEKDTYASALSLKNQFNHELNNAVVLILKGGIGSGILLNGNIFRGENGVAGELGHFSLEMNGPACKCGSAGCLEVYASDFAIVKGVINKINEGRESIIRKISIKDKNRIDIGTVIKAANLNDELSREVLINASKYVGTAISNIVKAYDPKYVVVESSWIKEVKGMFDLIVNTYNQKNTLLQKSDVSIVLNSEEGLYVKGATMLVQDYFMNSLDDNKLVK
jgi:predicted NBD/HSP70 family sugar kinase